MVNLTDPPTGGLDPKTDVSFHYWLRVYCLLLGVVALVAVASLAPNGLGDDTGTGTTAVWVGLLVVGALLTLLALVATARMQRQLPARLEPLLARIRWWPTWLPLLRWPALVLTALVAVHFGDAASMKGEKTSIIEIELSASSKAWDACRCDDAFTTAVHQDFWFIPAYVLLLALIAFWAGAYFRLPVVRRVRTYVVIAVIAAGVLDVVEDILMLNADGHDRPWLFAAVCAWAKFALLIGAIGYAVAGAFSWWSTPRWVRLASWALPAYAQAAAVQPATTGSDEATTGMAGGTQTVREAIPKGDPAHGIALSGGGIRASSISLGALQVLDGDRTLGWTRAHKITAVSGGSNMAAGWSISRSGYQYDDSGNPNRVPPDALDTDPWQMLDSGWLTIEERHLVDNLGYLASNQPRGSGTDPAAPDVTRQAGLEGDQPPGSASYRPAAYATVIAGLAVNTVVLVSMLWAITRPVGWGLRALTGNDGDLGKRAMHDLVADHSLAVPGLAFLALGFLFLMAWVAAGQFLIGPAKRHASARAVLQSLKGTAYGALALGAVLTLALWGFVELVGVVANLSLPAKITATGGAAGVLGSLVRILKKPAARFAPMLGGIAFLVVGLCLMALSTWTAAEHGVSWAKRDWTEWQSGYNWVLALVILAGLQLLFSPERWSLAPFYRGKLRLAYATYRTKDADDRQRVHAYENDNVAGDEKAHREPGFFAFNQDSQGVRTPLVVCTTSTVTSRAVRAHYGTPALSVTFDPDQVTLHLPQDGRGETLQYAATTKVVDRLGNKMHKRVTTMMAVAISSAAVSPAMGRIRIGPTSMLLTFFNIRLGVWIANPRFVTQLEAAGLQDAAGLQYPRTGLGYLFKEFFGIHDLDDPYLYLTDGGHWENTGLVELLRVPEVTEIVCIDADSGPGDATNSLGKAIAIAPGECDIRIDISLDPLRAEPSRSRAPAYSPRTVNIGFFSKGAGVFTDQTRVGVLWYAKPGLTKGMPAALLAFHERNPSYPRIGTLDQFFDTATFVAYRNLGRYNAREILMARRKLTEVLDTLIAIGDSQTVEDKLTELADDPNAHWAVIELARAARGVAGTDPQVRPDKVAAYCRAVKASLVG